MVRIDRDLAERTLASLPLSSGPRTFADWWLSQIGIDGEPLPLEGIEPLRAEIALYALTFEVRHWSTILCRSCGANFISALQIDLTGRDMLALVSPAHRQTRLTRFVRVAQGGLQFSYREVVTADGMKHQLQELLVPHPDSRVSPLEPTASMVVAYIDASAAFLGKHVLVSRGALEVSDEPQFVDLRPKSMVGPPA